MLMAGDTVRSVCRIPKERAAHQEPTPSEATVHSSHKTPKEQKGWTGPRYLSPDMDPLNATVHITLKSLKEQRAAPGSTQMARDTRSPGNDVTPAPGADPLGTLPMFDVKIPLTPARAAGIRRALTALDAVLAQRRELDLREHQLITEARTAGATWQQIAARPGYKDRQAAQQRHQALTRALAPPSQMRTRQP